MDEIDQTILKQRFIVRSYQVGPDKRISLFHLINQMMEAAFQNAVDLGASVLDLQDRGFTWVISRIKLDIHRFPDHQEEVEVHTWPSGFERYFFYRDFRVFKDGVLLASASSKWLVFDLNSRKMVAVPDFIINAGINREFFHPPEKFEKMPVPGLTADPYQFKVRLGHLDFNNHTYNAHYFQWLLEAAHEKGMEQDKLKHMDISFKSESRLGDELAVHTQKEKTNQLTILDQQIIHRETGNPIMISKSRYKP